MPSTFHHQLFLQEEGSMLADGGCEGFHSAFIIVGFVCVCLCYVSVSVSFCLFSCQWCYSNKCTSVHQLHVPSECTCDWGVEQDAASKLLLFSCVLISISLIVVYLCVAFLYGSRGKHADACLPRVVASVLWARGRLFPMLMDLVVYCWPPSGPCGVAGSIHNKCDIWLVNWVPSVCCMFIIISPDGPSDRAICFIYRIWWCLGVWQTQKPSKTGSK